MLAVEGRHEVWPVDVNGVWGMFVEYYREEEGRKIFGAEILQVIPPDSSTFDDMRDLIDYLFKDARLAEKGIWMILRMQGTVRSTPESSFRRWKGLRSIGLYR